MADLSLPKDTAEAILSAARSMANQRVPQHIMDECLSAGREGNIEALYGLIGSHPRVLDEIDSNPFAETPLHAAASAGHFLFAREIMQPKPSFRSKLNKNGFTPLNLALQEINKVDCDLQKGQRNVDPEMLQAPLHAHREELCRLVVYLLRFEQNLARVMGKEGLTPLHYAAQMGNLDLLVSILRYCPKSILDFTNRDDTVLHVALKHNQLPAYRLLVLWLRGAWGTDAVLHRRSFLEWRKYISDMAKDKKYISGKPSSLMSSINRGE